MGEQPIIFPQTGGVLTVSYELTCVSEEVTFYDFEHTEAKNWLTLSETHQYDPVTDTVTGDLTLTAGVTEEEHTLVRLYLSVNGNQCYDHYIEVKQEGINCSCANVPRDNVVIMYNGAEILPKEGVPAGSEIGSYKITEDCSYEKITATCVSNEVNYDVIFTNELIESETYKIKLGETPIPPTPQDAHGSITYTLSVSYDNKPCYELNFYQKGRVECNCDYIELFVKTGTTATFPTGGTYDSETHECKFYIVGKADSAVYVDENKKDEIETVCGSIVGFSTDEILSEINEESYTPPEGYERIIYEDPQSSGKNRIITEAAKLTQEEIDAGVTNMHKFVFKAGVLPATDPGVRTAAINFVFQGIKCDNAWINVERVSSNCNCDDPNKPNLDMTRYSTETGTKAPCEGTNDKVELGKIIGFNGAYRILYEDMKFDARLGEDSLLDPEQFYTQTTKKSTYDAYMGYVEYWELHVFGKIPENPTPTEERSLGHIIVDYYCTKGEEGSFDVLCESREFELIQAKCAQCNCETAISKIYGHFKNLDGTYSGSTDFAWCSKETGDRISEDLFQKECVVMKLGTKNEGEDPIFYNDTYKYEHIVDGRTVIETLTGYNGTWFFAYITREQHYEQGTLKDNYYLRLILTDEDHSAHREIIPFYILVGIENAETKEFEYCEKIYYEVGDSKCDCEQYQYVLDNSENIEKNPTINEYEMKVTLKEGDCMSKYIYIKDDELYWQCQDPCLNYYINDNGTKHSGYDDKYYHKKDGKDLFEAYLDTNSSGQWELNIKVVDNDYKCISFEDEEFYIGASYTDIKGVTQYCDDIGEFKVIVNKEPCSCVSCDCNSFKAANNIGKGNDILNGDWTTSEDIIVATYRQHMTSDNTVEIKFASIYNKCNKAKIYFPDGQDVSHIINYAKSSLGYIWGDDAWVEVSPIKDGTRETIINLVMVDTDGNPIYVDDEGKTGTGGNKLCFRQIKLIESFTFTCDDIPCSDYNLGLVIDSTLPVDDNGKYIVGNKANDKITDMFSINVPPDYESPEERKCFLFKVEPSDPLAFSVSGRRDGDKLIYSLETLVDLSVDIDYKIDINSYKKEMNPGETCEFKTIELITKDSTQNN